MYSKTVFLANPLDLDMIVKNSKIYTQIRDVTYTGTSYYHYNYGVPN